MLIDKNQVIEVKDSSLKGEIDVFGTLKIKGSKFSKIAKKYTLKLYYGCELYVGDVLYVGKEYTFDALISLGHGRYRNDPNKDPIIIIADKKISVDGKVYFNKTFQDSREYDLGYDSAAILYADSHIKFRSYTSKPNALAAIYNYGGVNDGDGAVVKDKGAINYLLGAKREWKNLMTSILEFLPVMLARTLEFTPSWNGKQQIDTEVGCDGQKISDLKYADRDGTRNVYDLWLPKYVLDGEKKGANIPVILFVHGGGWTSGKKEDEEQGCIRYCKQGYVTATLNYRLQNQPNALDNGNFLDMIEDIRACVADIKNQLEMRGYTSTRMALGGGSAGGHLSMLYGVTYGDESPIPVKLLIPRCGPSSFLPQAWANSRMIAGQASPDGKIYSNIADDPAYQAKILIAAGFAGAMVAACSNDATIGDDGKPVPYTPNEMLAASEDTNSELYKKIATVSPVLLWDKYKIPCVFHHGELDFIVSIDSALGLKTELERLGVDCKFIISPLEGHMLLCDESANIAYLEACQEFLDKYLKV